MAEAVLIDPNEPNAAEMARLKEQVERMTREAREAAAALEAAQDEARRALDEKHAALRARTEALQLQANAEVRAAKERLAASVRQARQLTLPIPPGEDAAGDDAPSCSSSSVGTSAATPREASVSSTPTWLVEAEELIRE